MKILTGVAVFSLVLATALSWMLRQPAVLCMRRSRVQSFVETWFEEGRVNSTWPGNRPPVPKPQRLGELMDANWGRGQYRKDIFEGGEVLNEWWQAFEFSEEELHALLSGYDFNNPEKWHADRGLNYTEAVNEMWAIATKQYEEYLEERRRERANDSVPNLRKLQQELERIRRLATEMEIRLNDDAKRRERGEPLHEDQPLYP